MLTRCSLLGLAGRARLTRHLPPLRASVFSVIFWLCLFTLISGAGAWAELVIVEKGRSLAPIIVYPGAPPRTRGAADELAVYIEKVSGAKPQVIEGTPHPVPERAIWVGLQPKVKELFPKIDFDFQHPEEILIAANNQHLVIAGRDRWNPEHLTVVQKRYEEPYQHEYGTCNAVYTFVQEQLGVRWLWPGETGEDVIRRETISLVPFEYRYHPPLHLRRGVMWWSSDPTGRGRLSMDWARLQRIYLDSSGNLLALLNGDHGFQDWWDRFHETHPEYFALQPDGTRSGFPGPDRAKMCDSNPAVWDQWVEDVAEQLKKNPNQIYFNAAANDNHLAGYCVCENCRAWDVPEAEKYHLNWKGHAEDFPALSDRQVRFANMLGRKLRARYPDKDYKVVIYAYGPSAPAPLKNVPDDNVLVALVPNMFDDINLKDRWSLSGQTSAQHIADWGATGAKLVWRPNLTDFSGMYKGHPDVPFDRILECYYHVLAHHSTGIALAGFWNFWPTQGPLYYVLAQLAWNPNQDARKILDDYYQRGFGPAAGSLKAYWTLMEETRNRMMDNKLSFTAAYDDKFFERAEGLLKEAETKLAHAPELYLRRIAHVRIGLDFTRRMIETRDLKERYEASQRKDAQIAAKLHANIEQLNLMARGDTTYLMGPVYGPLFLDRWKPATK